MAGSIIHSKHRIDIGIYVETCWCRYSVFFQHLRPPIDFINPMTSDTFILVGKAYYIVIIPIPNQRIRTEHIDLTIIMENSILFDIKLCFLKAYLLFIASFIASTMR